MFSNTFENKTVFVTGHTGFKGSWLCCWLIKLGANVVGYSKDIPTKPSMFESLGLEDKVRHITADIRDVERLRKEVEHARPDFIFHMAAQPIVSTSYADPLDTITSNVLGTSNLLDCLRGITHKCSVVIITSDKCYENVEWVWGYRESDPMGGKDIYSASKGAAELLFQAYFKSFLNNKSENLRVATARAGNVIGGGDWAKDRIIADCVKAWSLDSSVSIRCPAATRPWQHVLEPLSGYLNLAQELDNNQTLTGEQFNFGPRAEQNHDVATLITDLAHQWGMDKKVRPFIVVDEIPFNEAGLLKLNCDKANAALNWHATMTYDECVEFVSAWYKGFYSKKCEMMDLTLAQIDEFEGLARARKLRWSE